jgi:hypothetical protein
MLNSLSCSFTFISFFTNYLTKQYNTIRISPYIAENKTIIYNYNYHGNVIENDRYKYDMLLHGLE